MALREAWMRSPGLRVAAGAGLAVFTAACGSVTAPEDGVPNRRWGPPAPLATIAATNSFRGLDAALDESRAIVGYGIDGSIWASEAPARGAFPAPRRIDAGPIRFARGPALALAAGGIAVATWEQPDPDRFQGPMLVWSSCSLPGADWSAPALVERRVTAPEQVDPVRANLAPDVAVAPSGEAVVIWAAREVFASTSPDGATWGPPETLDSRKGPRGPLPQELRVRAGPPGRFVGAWADGPDGRAAWGDRRSGWGNVISFRASAEGFMEGVRLAADSAGRAVVAWHAFVEDARGRLRGTGVFAAVWSESTGWGSLGQLSPSGTEAFLIDVALDPAGGAAAIWWDSDERLWVSRRLVGGDWLRAVSVPGATLPSAATFLSDGSLLVVWADGRAIRASLGQGTAWSAPQTLQDLLAQPNGIVDAIAVAANARGEALVAWTRHDQDGGGSLWTSRLRED
jgi:hypothetical protein